VIYTRGQGFDGRFDEGTIGFPASDTDPGEAVEKILRILENYEKISDNCVSASREFRWSSVAERLINECYR
jgi:glycosyltransferase involved in cell wall biosynthesis